MQLDRQRRERARREITALAGDTGVAPADLLVGALGVLGEALPFDGACWHAEDPVAGFLATMGTLGAPAGDFASALHNEIHEPDVNKFADLAAGPVRVATLRGATGGRLARSPRYDSMLRPGGHGDELRAAFCDEHGWWGAVALWRDEAAGGFSPEDVALVTAIADALASGLRRAAAAAAWPADRPVPTSGVLLLDAGDQVEAADACAADMLGALGGSPGGEIGPLPGAVYVLAALARSAPDGSARQLRVRTPSDRWLLLRGSAMGSGRVALVIQDAPERELAALAVLALGFTAREREVATLVAAGRSTAEIASQLHLSPWTVQDHLKAIFAKAGVSSRRELTARLPLGATG